MRASTRAAGLAVAAALAATVGPAAFSGVAQADGLLLLKGWGTDQCLSTNHTSMAVTVDSCAKSDRWIPQATNRTDADGRAMFQLVNFPQTGLCMQAPNLVKGAGLRLATCNQFDLSQVWDNTNDQDSANQLKSGRPGVNLCLDRPTEHHFDGEAMQVWTCASPHDPVFGDGHDEQRFFFVN